MTNSLGYLQGNMGSSRGIKWIILGHSFSLSSEIGYSLVGCAHYGQEVVIHLYSSY